MNDNFDVNDVVTEYENLYKEQTRTAVILQAQNKGLIRTIEQRDAIIADLETQMKQLEERLKELEQIEVEPEVNYKVIQ